MILLRALILNGTFCYITSLCMQILNWNNSITISETFKSSFAFHAVVDTSVVSAHSVVEPDWSTTLHPRRPLCNNQSPAKITFD